MLPLYVTLIEAYTTGSSTTGIGSITGSSTIIGSTTGAGSTITGIGSTTTSSGSGSVTPSSIGSEFPWVCPGGNPLPCE